MKIRVILVACLFSLSAVSVQASDFVKSINQVLDYYLTGYPGEAAMELKKSMSILWEEVPLTVYNAKLVKDLKTYEDRADNVFDQNEPMHITWQIMGYGMKQSGNGYSINMEMDFQVISEDGAALNTKQNAQQLNRVDPAETTEFQAYLTYTLSNGVPGSYILRINLKDLNSPKTTSFDIPFVLQETTETPL